MTDDQETNVSLEQENQLSEHHSDGEHHHSGEEHHHSSGEHHHHHHHHHHRSGEGHHHSDEEHHHHHHHHHHRSSSIKKKRRWHWRGIKKSLKRLFLKVFKGEKNKNETEKQRILKRSIFLLFMLVIFSFTFYMLLLDNINGDDVSRAKKSSSEVDILKRQITDGELKIQNLEKENETLKKQLEMYKNKFGELDFSNIK